MLGSWLASEPALRRKIPKFVQAPGIGFSEASVARGGRVATDVVTFDVRPGAVTALGGPSGSGKTSCLLVLLGLAQLHSGAIRVGDHQLSSGDSIADSVAYIGQTPWLVEGSLADNLRVARPDAPDTELHSALEKVGATHLIDAHPQGINRPIGRGGHGLSGGERQRLALARAILRDAPVWLLDEPTAHLDADAERQILALLRQLAPGRTMLMATHSPMALAAADHVIQLPLSKGEAA
jgi:ATP-binding cassette subfamily C protein CydD